MISGIMLQILKVSLFTSVFIGILLLLVPLLQKRYGAKWRYIVWLLIAIRLLIFAGVALPQAPISIALPVQTRDALFTSMVYSDEPDEIAVRPSSADHQWQVTGSHEADQANQILGISETNLSPTAIHITTFTPIEIAGLIWLFGVFVFLMVQVCSYQIFLRRIKTAKTEPAPALIKESIEQLSAEMGLHKQPEPMITNAIDAPVLIGILHPRILMPHAQYEGEALSFILRHELVHYRRRDMLYKLILVTANALHWFNPMIYLMRAQAAKDIELACDDAVTRELDCDARARYGNTILSALPKKRRLEPVFSTHFGSGKKNIKARLRNLFDTSAKRRGTAMLCAVAVCVSIVTSFVTLGYAAESGSAKNTTHSTVTAQPSKNIGKEQKPLQNMIISANANDGTWAAASGIDEKTWLEQINYEIKWLDGTYVENKSGFVITEALPSSEASNIYRINYLYDHSKVFRDMSQMDGGRYVIENGRFSTGFGDTLTTDTIHRTVVVSDRAINLSLDIDYHLTEGKLAVWLIDPDGKITYQGSLNSTYKGVRTISGKKGLWSVIRVWQGNDNNSISGHVAITLRQNRTPQTSPIPATKENGSSATLSTDSGQPYFQIVSKNGKNVANSGSFVAKAGQRLTITAASSIEGGTVDLFLFSPSGKEQRITFGGSDKTTAIELTAGTWAYNCTGFYERGSIEITGVVKNTADAGEPTIKTGTEKYDNEVIRKMEASGTWGDYINQALPNMSPGAVKTVVDIYLDRHLFPNITTPEGARQVSTTIAPALQYMTKEAKNSAEKRIAPYY